MGEITGIQWTDKTWNPWHGCVKVSAGCKFCYMFREKEQYGQNGSKVLRSKTKFKEPMKWKEPALVFTCSWSDWFIEDADEWRGEAWEIIKATPHLTYQILTKRPERILKCLPPDWGDGYPNVWLGVSVENQEAVHRIGELERVPAKMKFISFEPLIGMIRDSFVSGEIDWIIIGGESGNDHGHWRYRPCQTFWIGYIIDSYRYGHPETKIFVKQMGTYLSKELQMTDSHGGNINDFPRDFMIREIPN